MKVSIWEDGLSEDDDYEYEKERAGNIDALLMKPQLMPAR